MAIGVMEALAPKPCMARQWSRQQPERSLRDHGARNTVGALPRASDVRTGTQVVGPTGVLLPPVNRSSGGRKVSDWPTGPQAKLHGQFIGPRRPKRLGMHAHRAE